MEAKRPFWFSLLPPLLLGSFLPAQTFSSPASQVAASEVNSPPPTLSESGTSPAFDTLTVRWERGQLSVIAHRVSLHNVLTAIARKTGMVVESAPGADAALVYIELGPASMRDVLKQILDGDDTNYILLGSATESGRIERLILSQGRQQPRNDRTNIAAVHPGAVQPEAYENDQDSTEIPPVSGGGPQLASDVQEQAPSTALAPVQNIDAQMSAYQQAFSDAAKSGKSRAEILQELQKQQIKDLDAAASQSSPN